MKVLIVEGNNQYTNMFHKKGWSTHFTHNSPLLNIAECDLVQFTGGADVSPSLYGEQNTASHCNPDRDLYEAGIFTIARRMGKPMAGICRGGQFLNVMCGGKMIQHVEGHATGGTHEAVDISSNDVIEVTSTHHQMMVAGYGGDFVTVARVRPSQQLDTEAVWYEDYGALCFQPHPEFGGHQGCTDYYFGLLDRFFGLRA